jgi:hypothetical protein
VALPEPVAQVLAQQAVLDLVALVVLAAEGLLRRTPTLWSTEP